MDPKTPVPHPPSSCCHWLHFLTHKPFNISALPMDCDMSSLNTAYKATSPWPLRPVYPPPQEPSSSTTQTEISPSSRHSHAHSTCREQFPNSRCFYSPSGHHKFFQDKGDPSGSVTHAPPTEIKAPTPHKGEEKVPHKHSPSQKRLTLT